MVQFLYPIGLVALVGLIIPLIIHLWNIKQGKTLKIGSISLLGESSVASAKSLKINDWLLLLLRCLLLIILSFLLAQPFLKKNIENTSKGGWILIDKTRLSAVLKTNKTTIDSLLTAGYQMHDFNIGFTQIQLKDTTNNNTVSTYQASYTSLLKQLNTILPKGFSVYLYADHRLRNVDDDFQALTYQLNWKTINQADTLSSWISDLAGKKYAGKSNPTTTTYDALNTNYIAPIQVAIYETSGNADRNYLIAAIKAIAGFSNRKIEINTSNEKADVGFWLSEEPVSSIFRKSIHDKGNLFKYEKGKIITTHSFMRIDDNLIKLNKRITYNNLGEEVWNDGYGNPLLSKETLSGFTTFHFYSRFNPQWNELVWNDLFVKSLLPIIIRDEKSVDFGFEDHPDDQRVFSTLPKINAQNDFFHTKTNTEQHQSIAVHFWLLAFLVLSIERFLTYRSTSYVKS